MPVDRNGVGRRLAFRNARLVRELATRTRPQKHQPQQSADQVETVGTCHQIEERAVRIARQINSLSRELTPRDQLRREKSQAEYCSERYPLFVERVYSGSQFSPSVLECHAAAEYQCRTQ